MPVGNGDRTLRQAVLVTCIAAAAAAATSIAAWDCTSGQTPDLTLPIQAMVCGSGSGLPNCHDASTSKGFGFFTLNIGEATFSSPCEQDSRLELSFAGPPRP